MHLCPTLQKPGKPVRLPTLLSLVKRKRLAEVAGRDWFFCALQDCDVVYFAGDGTTIAKGDLEVRVGLKEKSAPHTVCYCFGHTEESIREEVVRTGRSTVVDSITARVRAGECTCETTNPQGTCCLGDVAKVVKKLFQDPGDMVCKVPGPHSGCCNK